MKIEVYNGKQIGGCVTTIETKKGTKICIDIGEELPAIDNEKPKKELRIPGLTKGEGKAEYDAVFITHYHGDHIGKYNKVFDDIPIYIGEVSKKIYKILQERLVKAKIIPKEDLDRIETFKTYKIPEEIKIGNGDIIVKPIEVDHSAFNAHMLLIECDGKKILHTGDFRLHGPRGKAVITALKKYVGQVDYLICEGTTLSRKKEKTMKEIELKNEAKKLFQKNKYCFVMCSSTNIDRIAEIHKATIETGKIFVCDDYQKELLDYIDTISRSELYKFEKQVEVYNESILENMKQKGFVMLVRDNYISKKVLKEFPERLFIYSQWEGYLNPKFKQYERLQKFVPRDHIKLHTSGHADYEAIKKVCQLVKPKVLIPIHGENPEAFKKMGLKDCKIKIGEKIMRYNKVEDLLVSTKVNIKRNGNMVTIKINEPIANMQTDYADFEAISLMYKTIENDIEVEIEFEIPGSSTKSNIKDNKLKKAKDDKKINMQEIEKWNGKFGNDNANINSYLRFLFRIMIFKKGFANWVHISNKNKEELERFENLYNKALQEGKVTNNFPTTESNYHKEKGEEHVTEKKLTHTEKGNNYLQELYQRMYPNEKLTCMYDQLPNGLFNTEISEEPRQKNRIFTSGAYDIWGIDSNENFCVFELKKDKGNAKLGVISELYFYAVFAKEILCKQERLNSKGNKVTYRGYDKLYEYTTNAKDSSKYRKEDKLANKENDKNSLSIKEKKVRGIFLLGDSEYSVHSAIREKKDDLLEVMNTNSFGIEFNFVQYSKEKIDEIPEKDIDIRHKKVN